MSCDGDLCQIKLQTTLRRYGKGKQVEKGQGEGERTGYQLQMDYDCWVLGIQTDMYYDC